MYKPSHIRFHVISVILILILINVNVYIFINAADKLQLVMINATVESAGIPQVTPESAQPNIVEEPGIEYTALVENFDDKDIEQKVSGEVITKQGFGTSLDQVIKTDLSQQGLKSPLSVPEDLSNAQPDYGIYRVSKGDSLYWIAERYDTTIDKLRELNRLTSDLIHADQVLVVPVSTLKEYPVGLSLTDKEVQWIAQMIHAEARGEPYIGQVAVGAVIINRIKSRKFPNTVYHVLFQENAFQPIRNGTFFATAGEQAYRAAHEALGGNDPTNGALYFFNPKLSNSKFMHARPALITIGQHRFAY